MPDSSAQFYILGRLRNVTFFSLDECNTAIKEVMERLNGRVMRRLGVSRRQLFEAVERPAMQSLPDHDYEYADWHLARVGIDYHVEVAGFFYSVPHGLIREQVDTRATVGAVEVFHRGKLVAAHARRYGGPRHGTQLDTEFAGHVRGLLHDPETGVAAQRGEAALEAIAGAMPALGELKERTLAQAIGPRQRSILEPLIETRLDWAAGTLGRLAQRATVEVDDQSVADRIAGLNQDAVTA